MQIREWADSGRAAVILHPSGIRIGFAELEARANRLAHHFRAMGLVEGDAVAVLMENNEHVHAVLWAARRCGLYYATISTHLTAPEAAYIVENSGARAIIGSAVTRDVCAELGSHPAASRRPRTRRPACRCCACSPTVRSRAGSDTRNASRIIR